MAADWSSESDGLSEGGWWLMRPTGGKVCKRNSQVPCGGKTFLFLLRISISTANKGKSMIYCTFSNVN